MTNALPNLVTKLGEKRQANKQPMHAGKSLHISAHTFSYWIEINKLCFARDIFLKKFSTPLAEVLVAPLSVLVSGIKISF